MGVLSGSRARSGPRLYYGWALVLTLALTETTSYGILYYSFTVFLAPMGAEQGWSRAAMTGAFSLAQLMGGIAAVPTGRWLDRHGPRLLMTAGSIAATLLVLAWASVSSLLALYLVWAAIGVTTAAVLYEPAFVVVATWFSRGRGRALTVLTFIAGFASVIYIPLAGWLVEVQGWRTALVTLAVILGVGTIPLHALLLRRRPADMGLLPDGVQRPRPNVQGDAPSPLDAGIGTLDSPREQSVPAAVALRGATFRWLTAAFCLNTVGIVAVSVHLVPYLTDHGHSAGFAASVAGLIGVMALPGRLIFTPLGDRVPRSLLTAFIFSLQAVALTVLLLVPSVAGIAVFVALFGAGFGAITPMKAALVAEYYGPAQYGSISGVLALFLTAARAVGPVSVGLAHDAGGSYAPAFWTLTALSLVAAGAILVAERAALVGTLRAAA
jgi:MFS family permease